MMFQKVKIVASKLIQCGGNLKTEEINTIAPLDMIIKRNDVSMIELQHNLTVLKTKTQCDNNIVCVIIMKAKICQPSLIIF